MARKRAARRVVHGHGLSGAIGCQVRCGAGRGRIRGVRGRPRAAWAISDHGTPVQGCGVWLWVNERCLCRGCGAKGVRTVLSWRRACPWSSGRQPNPE